MLNKKLSAVLVLLLALTLTFSFTACGGTQEEVPEESDLRTPASLTEEDWEMADDGGDPVICELGVKETGEEWTMSGSIDKLDYGKLDSEKENLENNMKEALKASDLDVFELYTEYEEDEGISPEEAEEYGIEVGELLFTSGIEDDDMDKRVVEAGAYNNPQDGSYYQYTVYSSESVGAVEDMDVDSICNIFSGAYGVTLDKDLLSEGLKAAYDRAANYVAPEIPEVGEDEDSEEAEDLSEEIPEEETPEEEVLEEEPEEAESELAEEGDGTEELTEEELQELLIDDGEGEMEEYDFEDDYTCTLQQSAEFKGDGYTDRVILNITAMKADKEDVPGGATIYVSVERDRMYD